MQDTWQGLLKQQITELYVQNPVEWLDVNLSTSGLLNLTIVSDRFVGLSLPQRKEQVLSFLNRSQIPHLSPGFLSFYTFQEAESLGISRPQVMNEASVYTWQDLAINAANPQNQFQVQAREPRLPRTVTFYSFKGGVGRTTALTHVAWILAMRGRKVVAVDLDLEAPGLSTAFNLNPQPQYGIVDYFYERSYLPEGSSPSISVSQIFGEVRIPNATGRLFVVPAGDLNLNYLSKVDDLRATTIIDSGDNLWSIFSREIQEQLKPDILLVDSRTGINQWGAFSLLQAADEVIIFLFPNEQNRQGIDLLLQSLKILKNLSINFVFTPVPDVTEVGITKVRNIWKSLQENLNTIKYENDENNEDEINSGELEESQFEFAEPLVVPYLSPIALADSYPVPALLDYYTRIANLIDEKTDDLKRVTVLTSTDNRWEIIENLQFSEVNAADPRQNLDLLFQRTTDFERFLDDTTCLVRGRKGTGKTALYWLLLKHSDVARKLARGRLDYTVCFSAHGRFYESRPSRDEFRVIHKSLQEREGAWEAFWRGYLLLRAFQEEYFSFPGGQQGKKFSELKTIINNLSKERWQYEHTQALVQLSTESQLQLIVKDAIDIIDEKARKQSQIIWFLYDDLDEDFPEEGEVRQKALTGLFQLIQSCDARRLIAIRFKIFLREDIWNRLNFDNKSHFNGRDIVLQWTRIDFLRLALRQAIQSPKLKNLVDRFSPVESIDQASEEAIDRALELLWGSRRRRGDKAKYVSRWVYERLNACYSEVQAKAISQHVNYVIGMNRTIGDKAAIAFSVAFYDALAAGQQMEFAYKLGRSVLMNYLEQQTPILLKKDQIGTVQPFFDIVPPNPYVGLAAFTEVDAAFFFGRETFVNGLVEAVNQQPLVGVIGPSGSGKSSVVYAGLFPQLRISGNWLIESFRPGDKPFYQLASVLVRLLEPEIGETAQLREAVGLAADMELKRITLSTVISRLNERQTNKRLLLFADQFEELYTLCQNKEVIERFVDALLAAIHLDNFTLVFTLRADFYSFVLGYRPFRDALEQFTPKLLSSMNREELLTAIEQPAQKMVVQLEAQLTERILDDVGNEPGNLPLLEFALTRLWSLQQKRKLTHQAYDQIGGVKKALANHAEEVYKRLDETQQKIVPRIFVQLVRPGEGTEDTRRIATRAEVGEENWGLVSYLAGYPARLVVTGRDEKSLEDTVEVVHEALIREWLTLREWMNANRQFRLWQERLKVAVLEWKNSNYDSGALLRGVPLVVAQDWLHKRVEEITPQERDFINASVQERFREQEKQAKEQQERERRRRTSQALIGILVVALSLLGFAFWQWQLAENQRLNAQISVQSLTTENLFASGFELDALLASLNTGESVKKYSDVVDTDNRTKAVVALQQIVYGLKEHNRLEGHSNPVTSVVFSPDGETIATGSDDYTVRLWNLSGQELHTLQGHRSGVTSVVFSPDGKTIASGSKDKTVRLWNLNGQEELHILKGHSGAVNSVVFSPDGKTIATGSSDKTVKLWNLSGQELHTFKGHSGAVNSVVFSPDGKTIATGSSDKTVKLWNLSGQELHTFKGHSGAVNSVVFSPDGKTIASGSYDNTVKLWNLSGQELHTLKEYGGSVNSVVFSPDGKMIATGSDDNTVRLWNLSGQELLSLKGHSDRVNRVVFSPDGKMIATASSDNTVRLWNLSGQELHTFKGHSDRVNRVVFSPDGKTIATAGSDNTVKLWNLFRQELHTFKGHSGEVLSVILFSPDGKTIATAGSDNTARLWNLSGQELLSLKGHSDVVSSVVFSPDGKTIATGSWDKTVKLWNLSGQELHVLKGHDGAVNSVVFSPDGKTIASGSEDKTVRLWNLSGQELHVLKGHDGAVNSVVFSPDGKTIAFGSEDKTVRLWNLSGQELHTLKGHSGRVNSVVFSPDGKTIASGSEDKTVRLWNLSGQELHTLKGHSSRVNSVVFSPDGKTIASGSADKTVRLWNLSGQELHTLNGHSGSVLSVMFSPDGKTIASGSSDNTVKLWNMDLDDLLRRGCDWASDYLKNNPNVKDDRHLCDNIPNRK